MTTLPLKGTLTSEESCSPVFSFTGTVCILIEGGEGTVELQRSLCDSEFKTVTDTSGCEAKYNTSEGVAFNADISNTSNSVRYRIKADVESPIKYIVCR